MLRFGRDTSFRRVWPPSRAPYFGIPETSKRLARRPPDPTRLRARRAWGSFVAGTGNDSDATVCSHRYVRSGKLQNESFPNFSNFHPEFCPEFCSEFSPNFSRIFRASFRGRRRPEKIHQKSLRFFNAKFPGKHDKNIHKILLESRQSNNMCLVRQPLGNFCCQIFSQEKLKIQSVRY